MWWMFQVFISEWLVAEDFTWIDGRLASHTALLWAYNDIAPPPFWLPVFYIWGIIQA